MGIYELLSMTSAIKDRIAAKAPAHEIRNAARAEGFRTLRDDGVAKVQAGITTIEEVIRVTQLE